MRRTLLPSALLASALLLSACGGSDAASADGDGSGSDTSGGVTVQASEFAFEPDSFTLPADEAVELTLDNQGVV
jgi:ABC-type glycerol-3-phosphate transport system substrate-binding protein